MANGQLNIYVPDAQTVVIPDNGQTVEEIRRSLVGLYPQLQSATGTREGCAIRFTRPAGGAKGL